MHERTFHLTTAGAILISLGFMVVGALENTVAPWTQFCVVYTALATMLPLKWRTYRFGPVKAVRWWMWVACPLIAIALQALASELTTQAPPPPRLAGLSLRRKWNPHS